MKVNKLTSANQPENWFERITSECQREYPIHLMADISSDELVIDAGCNVGGFAEAYKHRFSNFLAIDASAYNIEQYQSHHHYPTLHKALYSVDNEIVKLKKYMVPERDNDDTNSGNYSITGFYYENKNGWSGDEYEEVQTISLETILNGIESVGLLKVDIEGAEMDFLFNKDLSKIKWITGEFHNFLGGVNQKKLFTWIENTHQEVYSDGNGLDSHFQKAWRRKDN